MSTQRAPRTTKRKYAHELHPHPAEGETWPLAVEVPYHYARALGLQVFGTGWYDQLDPKNAEHERREAAERINAMVDAYRLAFLLDALHQGTPADEAWAYANSWHEDAAAEHVWERAEHYGVDVEAIKPYPCGPEPAHHDHYGPPLERPGSVLNGSRQVIRIEGPESGCFDCTEWVCTCTPEQVDLECAFHNDHPAARRENT